MQWSEGGYSDIWTTWLRVNFADDTFFERGHHWNKVAEVKLPLKLAGCVHNEGRTALQLPSACGHMLLKTRTKGRRAHYLHTPATHLAREHGKHKHGVYREVTIPIQGAATSLQTWKRRMHTLAALEVYMHKVLSRYSQLPTSLNMLQAHPSRTLHESKRCSVGQLGPWHRLCAQWPWTPFDLKSCWLSPRPSPLCPSSSAPQSACGVGRSHVDMVYTQQLLVEKFPYVWSYTVRCGSLANLPMLIEHGWDRTLELGWRPPFTLLVWFLSYSMYAGVLARVVC